MEYLVAFGSTHAALSFEAAFGEGGSIVPVPPSVRAGCGMALHFFADSDGQASACVQELASKLGVTSQIDGVFGKEGKSYSPIKG